MTAAVAELVLRRDRVIVASAVGAITALAWSYVIWLAARMDMGGTADGMSGMSMPEMMAPDLRPWGGVTFLFMFAMWAVMMVGMMTPSVAPMVLIYARVARQAVARGKPFAATGWFLTGYLLSWTGFALGATAAQWGLERAALLTPLMTSGSRFFGAAVLILAGLYQWTPLKDACLGQCQAPLVFIQQHGGFRGTALGTLGLGVAHGLYCVGCCWALMALLFVGGVMNLLWIAAISIFVLLEKVVPAGRVIQRAAGAGLVGAGVWLLAA
jgi:predicted metal-binding membrane protein